MPTKFGKKFSQMDETLRVPMPTILWKNIFFIFIFFEIFFIFIFFEIFFI